MLVLAVCGIFSLSIFFSARDKVKEEELHQHLLEMELRECEVNLDVAELRADITRLRMAYEPERFAELEASQHIEDVGGHGATQQSTEMADGSSGRTLLGSFLKQLLGDDENSLGRRTQQSLTRVLAPRRLSAEDAVLVESSKTSFEVALYPCYVLPLSRLTGLTRLPVHEDVHDMLEELTPRSLMPSSAFAFFVRFDMHEMCDGRACKSQFLPMSSWQPKLGNIWRTTTSR